MSPAPARSHPGDCPRCGAPAPARGGAITHRWDCPGSDEPKSYDDWYARGKRPRVRSIELVPLPPLKSLRPDEKAELIALAREIEEGWRRMR
jgi:hypothetical protein